MSKDSGPQQNQPAKVMTEAQMEKQADNVSASVHEPPADPKAAAAAAKKAEDTEVVKKGQTGTGVQREPQVVHAGKSGVAEANRRVRASERRKHIEDVIKRGESVFYHDPRNPGAPPLHIMTLDQIPHEAEIAGDDPEDQEAARRAIDGEIDRLTKLRNGIGKSR